MGSNKKQALVDTKKSKRKKKGRPSLIEIEKRRLQNQTPNQIRRSTRRNPNPNSAGEGDEEEEEDEEDLRKEKKVKLVGKIPNGSDLAEESGSDSDGSRMKKRKIDVGTVQTARQNSSSKGTDENLHGNPSNSGPTTPLPDKKLLVFILDRLQKKDTYGVFSEPVDAEELPDYHDIIKHPMDFSTVRKKLDGGAYKNLEQFESDVFLISSNAMQYNADDTVYYRQARSIQELARKDFESLRHESDDNESEPKIPRRGRPPMKNILKRIGRPPIDRTGSEFSSDTTPANAKDGAHGISNPMRDASRRALDKPNMGSFSRGGEEYSGSPLKGIPVKNWKRFSEIDENRRNTYNHPLQSTSFHEPSILNAFDGERKTLMPVGLYMMNAYARSLARFAANLGPIGWEITSKRLEKILPPGTQFGPGWIGQNESSQAKANKKPENHETTSNNLVTPVKHENGTEISQPCLSSKLNGFRQGHGANLPSPEAKAAAVGGSSSNGNNNDVRDVKYSRDSEAKVQVPSTNRGTSSDVNADYSEDTKQQVQQKQPELALQL